MVKEPAAWNKVVEESPYAVLHHRYDLCCSEKNSIPLMFEEGTRHLLLPLQTLSFLGFKVAASKVYYHVSIIPDNREGLQLIPKALDSAVSILRRLGYQMLVLSGPSFLSKEYGYAISSWFRSKGAHSTLIYAHLVDLRGKGFHEIWTKKFSKHARNAARRAEKLGVQIDLIEDIEEWIDDLVLCNVSSLRRQKRIMLRKKYDRELFLSYLKEHKESLSDYFRIFGAFYRGRLIAFVTTLEFRKLLLITSIMSRSDFLSKRPNDALLTHVIRYACDARLDWVYYSFDRVSQDQSKHSLLPSLMKFKFEHAFDEFPVPIYRLPLSAGGKFLGWGLSLRDYAFVGSAGLPQFLVDLFQKLYERCSNLEMGKMFFQS
jgi:hypothetical protein